jgi:hypothetical protein
MITWLGHARRGRQDRSGSDGSTVPSTCHPAQEHPDRRQEHFPEKWEPVFPQKKRQIKNLERFPIHLKRKAL